MQLFTPFPLLLLALSFTVTLSAQVTITYEISDEDFLNPERGFYYPSSTHQNDDPFTYNNISADWVASRREAYTPWRANYQVRSSLFFRYFMLHEFVDSPISEGYLENMAFDFASIRAAGSKVIIRFSYNNTLPDPISPPFGDASKAQVLEHIQQLTPLLQANADIIATAQLGFIGTWGEGYYTDHFGFTGPTSQGGQPALSAENWQDRNEIIQAWLMALPPSRSIQVRYPQQKQKFEYGPTAPTSSAPTQGRIGFHNDCFLASDFDFGTYANYDPWTPEHDNQPAELRTYKANASLRVPVGGETCFINEDTPTDIQCRTNGGRADSDLALFHYDFLNSDYNNDVNNTWTSICMEDIKRRLGYRFELVSSTLPNAAQAGQTIDVDIQIRNIGYSVPYNPRGLELVLRNLATEERFFVGPNSTPQDWLPNSTSVLEQSFCLPNNLPQGQYNVLLHLPDPAPSLYGRPAYAIRLASYLPTGEDVWESNTGYNQLGHTLTVNSTATGNLCNGESTFGRSSDIVTTEDISYANKISVYPNPSRQSQWVKYDSVGECQLLLYDYSGRLVWQGHHHFKEAPYLLPLQLTPGIYNLVLIDQQLVHTQKVIVQ